MKKTMPTSRKQRHLTKLLHIKSDDLVCYLQVDTQQKIYVRHLISLKMNEECKALSVPWHAEKLEGGDWKK